MTAINHRLKFKKPNRFIFKDSFNQARFEWVNPVTHQVFSISHLKPFFLSLTYLDKSTNQQLTKSARVSFSPHCYSREMKGLDDPQLIVVTEKKGNHSVDRIFDTDRWNHSISLAKQLQSIHNISCKRDSDNQVVIYFEKQDRYSQSNGWYTFIRIQIDPKYPDILQLEVRTTHRRPNHPSSAKYPLRFNQHVADILSA